MGTEDSKNSEELQVEVQERTHEVKQYLRAYGPRILLVSGIAVSSCFLLGYIIRKAIQK